MFSRFVFGGADGGRAGGCRPLPPPPLSLCAHNAAPAKRSPLPAAAAMLAALSMCRDPASPGISPGPPGPPPTNPERCGLPPAPLQGPRGTERRSSPSSGPSGAGGSGGTQTIETKKEASVARAPVGGGGGADGRRSHEGLDEEHFSFSTLNTHSRPRGRGPWAGVQRTVTGRTAPAPRAHEGGRQAAAS